MAAGRPLAGRPARRRPRHRGGLAALPFILPVLAIYGVFVFYPVIYSFYLSLTRWNGLAPRKTFVGLDNYRFEFQQDPIFWSAFGNTVIWTVLSIVVSTILGLALALMLNRSMPARGLFRSIIYAPGVLATVVVSMIWSWMYNPVFGPVNKALRDIGQPGLIQSWLGDGSVALYSVFVASTWQATGISMVLFLAGLQGVPKDPVEAAQVDGAGRVSVFRYAMLPALRGTFVVVIALTIVNSLKAFDLIYAMTYGGPGNATQTLATWAYFKAFNYHLFGAGSAVAVVLLLVTMVVVIPYVRWASRSD